MNTQQSKQDLKSQVLALSGATSVGEPNPINSGPISFHHQKLSLIL